MVKVECRNCSGNGQNCPKCNGYGYILVSEEKPRRMAYNKPHGTSARDLNFNQSTQ